MIIRRYGNVLERCGAEVARRVHTPEVPGSIPGIATVFRAVSSRPSRTLTPLLGLPRPGRFLFGV